MRGNKLFLIFLYFLLGVFIGYASTQYTYFDIAKEVNLVDIGGIIVNIALAYFISKVLEKRKTEDRVEKDIIIEKLKNIISISSKIPISEQEIEFSKAVGIFKELSTETTALKNIIDYSNLGQDLLKVEGLKGNILRLKQLITNQPVLNHKIILGPVTSNRAIVLERQLRDHIFKIIIDCNRI